MVHPDWFPSAAIVESHAQTIGAARTGPGKGPLARRPAHQNCGLRKIRANQPPNPGPGRGRRSRRNGPRSEADGCCEVPFPQVIDFRLRAQFVSQEESASVDARYHPIGGCVVREELRPRIECEYEYRGRRYVNRRLTFRDARLWNYEQARAERQLIEPGTELRVYVSPSNASKEIMKPVFEYRYIVFFAMVFTTGLLIGGVGAWVRQGMCV
jgi:hypothetical protein